MDDKFVMKLRDALREELDATNTYARLLECAPGDAKSIIEEIQRDEINHQGRLLAMILKTDASQMEPFNKGLGQQE